MATNHNNDAPKQDHCKSASTTSILDRSPVISFPVPSKLTTNWLLKKAPVVLAKHLVYTRGLWPMSVPQLSLLQQQQQQQQQDEELETIRRQPRPPTEPTGGDPFRTANAGGSRKPQAAIGSNNSKRRRLATANGVNASLRRKQQQATGQMTRLFDEWTRVAADDDNNGNRNKHTSFDGPVGQFQQHHNHRRHSHSHHGRRQTQQTDAPRFLLISLGPSYGRSRELYLLDFQSLIDDDDLDNDGASGRDGENNTQATREQEQKMEAMLARKLVSALMNHHGDNDQQRPLATNSLPPSASPSFRLWFTAGFRHRGKHGNGEAASIFSAPNHDDDDNDNGTIDFPARLAPPSAAASAPSPFSTASWIPRSGFPLAEERTPKRRSPSRSQSLVTIRFQRSRKRHQQQPSAPRDESNGNHYNDSNSERARNDTNSTAPPMLRPTSEQLTWMSLSTCLKGFRL